MSIYYDNKASIDVDSCRVCLDGKLNDGIDLTKDENMLQWFEYCVGVSINIQCPPKRICVKCADSIKNYVKFKQKCLESEDHWMSYCKVVQNCNLSNVKEEHIKCEYENIYYEEKHTSHYEDKTNIQEILNTHDSIKNNIVSTTNLTDRQIENDTDDRKSDIKSFMNNENTDNIQLNKTDTLYFGTSNICNEVTKRYQCEKCNKEYRKHKWLVTHKMNTCYKDDNKYRNVDIELDKNKILKLEESNIENIQTSSTCGLCKTPYSCDITNHMDEHWSNNDLQCQLCNYCGRDFADMIAHSFEHCPKMKLFCHACKKKKASIPSLQFHFRSVHLQKAGGICSVCNKTFKKFKTWKRHERLHNENSLFICDHCGRKFLYKHEIKSHLIYHTDVRLFVCETCGKGFRRMSGLKDHIKNLHSAIHPVKCSHCDKMYKSQTKLEIHLRNLTKDKPFICDVCSKRFISQKVLQKHMFWHTDERPYSCEVCGSRYKAKGNLNLHMRNHTGFMPHKCVDCGKSFPTAKQLKRHRSVHTGVRAYKCVHCERSFHEKKTMLEHATQHKNSQALETEN